MTQDASQTPSEDTPPSSTPKARKTSAKKAAKKAKPSSPKPKKKTAKGADSPEKLISKMSASAASQLKEEAKAETSHLTGLTIQDHEKMTEYLSDVATHARGVVDDYIQNRAKYGRVEGMLPVDPLNIGEAMGEVAKGFAANPGKLVAAQMELWRDYSELWGNFAKKSMGYDVEPLIAPDKGDKRFRNEAWEESQVLDFMKQSYLIMSRWLTKQVSELDTIDEPARKRAEFYTKQFVDAISPTNFAMTNPEVMKATLETKGENLMQGLRNLLEDMDRGDGSLMIRQTDMEYFKVGENVATAPGKVIYQNEVMQLIQYAPATEKVHKRPLLIFPPWINKFYILDLREENSFIRWATEQGRTVFLVSWVNPGPELKDYGFDDYMQKGVFEALDAVEKAVGEREVDTIGYCVGGTLLTTALAYMSKTGDDRIKSATYFASQADFSEAGELMIFIDENQIQNIERQMDASGGVLDAQAMATTFNMLRSNDLIWSFVINNYMLGKDPKRFDLLYWNADSTRMPKVLHAAYLRDFYYKNLLAKGEYEMLGETLAVSDVKIPVYLLSAKTDHIAPTKSVYNAAQLFGGPVRFICSGSGHIAGVINHPDAQKYQFWTNDDIDGDHENWLAGAQEHPGSWWPDWIAWLDALSPEMTDARDPAKGGLTPLEDAPGSYVKVQSFNVDG